MASLLPDVLFEARGQAPAPSKDFYQLLVNQKDPLCTDGHRHVDMVRQLWSRSQKRRRRCRLGRRWHRTLHHPWPPAWKKVVFRWWKISLRSEFREAKPGELKESHEDFLDDPSLQIQVAYIFGPGTLDHIFNLCQGKFDFLARLPDQLLLYIMAYLDPEDIFRLAQVSHRFERLCNSDEVWEMTVQKMCGHITEEMTVLARDMGWKQFFFTNKLQLQLQFQMRRQKEED